tara:strand:- start:6291 stop:6710 length:420 start_codon:yes stop_codon:yes gene_type:complete
MNSNEESLFEKAMSSYQSGSPASELINDFEEITAVSPNNAAGWTCLAWLQLLCNQNAKALRSARTAVKLNGQDPQARINLTLALLETDSKGVREHIEFIKRAMLIMPELEKELKKSIEDGLQRKNDWMALSKVKKWLDL